jgi:hypothetical protein
MSKPVLDPATNRRPVPRERNQRAAIRLSEEPTISVAGALALAPGAGIVEVYVDWSGEAVQVSSRARGGSALTWEVASMLLRDRVACAIQPLVRVGWRLDGTLFAAMRWNTSFDDGPQQYDGCWVRMRSPEA